ncbi:hypothetical protein B5K06_22860 [Rhizobium grahamii]|uniref:Uncharacterized protein n=1 Tax=Rhizobium grahamii TaxID=1120045 RepID=A0A370KJU5_9HYPH|nr:hypothetical protein B5K06_22860 [Rhizobium grahamii]
MWLLGAAEHLAETQCFKGHSLLTFSRPGSGRPSGAQIIVADGRSSAFTSTQSLAATIMLAHRKERGTAGHFDTALPAPGRVSCADVVL